MKPAVFFVCRLNLIAVSFLISAVLTGCTSTTYKSNLAPSAASPADYPILVYTEDKTVPRPCETIGSISIKAEKFTMFGGSIETEMKEVMATAHEKGADVVKLTSVDSPDFGNPNYSLHADLLRYADVWEKTAISREQFQDYLATNRAHLDPIEGIWISGGMATHAIGIMKDTSKLGRDFIGFVLESANRTWPYGTKKMDIRRGALAGNYVITYYLDNFERAELPIILGQKRTFKLSVWRADDDSVVVAYNKK